MNPLFLLRCRNTALDQSDIVRGRKDLTSGLQEVSDLDDAHKVQQLVFQVQQLQLTAVAAGEFKDGQLRLGDGRRRATVQGSRGRHD